MAVPTILVGGALGSKATLAATSYNITVSWNAVVGDYMVMHASADPSTTSVDVNNFSGTAVFSAWTKLLNANNGAAPGTSGVRTAVHYATCTTAGTVTNVAVQWVATAPAVTEETVYLISGAGSIACSGIGNATVLGATVATMTPAGGAVGLDVLGVGFYGVELPAATAIATGTIFTGFTAVSRSASTVGQTGGAASTNISIAYVAESQTAITSANIVGTNMAAATGSLNEQGYIVFAAPASAAVSLPELVMAPSRGF